MFEYYGHVHVYSPRAGADNPPEDNVFHKHKYSVYLSISCKVCPSNHILTIFLHTNDLQLYSYLDKVTFGPLRVVIPNTILG